MIKKYSLVVVAFLCFIFSGFGQATLPVSTTNLGRAMLPTGFSHSGLGSDYAGPRLKFDDAGDYLVLFFNGTPNVLTFDIGVNNTFPGTIPNNATFTVQESINGSTWTGLGSYSNVAGGTKILNPSSSTRYIRWYYTTKPSGTNIALYNINLTASTSDPNLVISGTPTDHGSVCPTFSATTRTYTITNSGTIAAAGITVVSDDAQFVVTALSSTTIAASGTATYKVTFTPASAGAKTAAITVASTTATSNSPTSSLTGTGASVVNQTVSSAVATVLTANSATLNGNVTNLGTCPNTNEKGFVYSQTSLNANPLVGGVDVTKTTVAGLTTGTFNLPIAGLNNGTNYTFKPYVYNGTSYTYGGTRNFTTLNTADFCNLQFPANGTITAGNLFNVYARIYEPGMTTNVGVNPAISAWIGYSTTNNNPNSAGWTWVPATFDADYGNDDEYVANIGAGITAGGTYYYASRFQINTGPYTYGGISPPSSGNFWDGTTYISGVLTVNADQVDFCNVDYPKMGTVELGNTFNVYAQGYEPGLTNVPPAQAPGLNAWIGYNSIGINHQPWNPTGWTWVPATYDSDSGNNDQYVANLGAVIPASGTYYYASRWQLNGSDFSYGGITSDNVGNFWNVGTTNSGVLTITEPPIADVVITEIMYNSIGTDDEWIEICNVSGSTQNLSSYRVQVEGTTEFTFPPGTFILDSTCITVSLGSNGDGIYNNPCPFTPDYELVDAFTNDTDVLINSPGDKTIELFAANGISLVDEVTYNRNHGGNGNDATLHVIDINEDNSTTATNWQQVFDGGTPGINFLVSSCSPLVPKLDVERNTYASIAHNGGATTGNNTLWGGVVNVGTSANKTYYLRNEGYANLTVSSLISSNPDWTFVGLPTFPIVMVPGALVMFELSFSPTTALPVDRTGIITINSDDPTYPARTFNVKGKAGCPLYTGTIYPTSGPVGTEVTITSTQNLTGATATLNGQAVTVLSSSVGTLLIKIPDTVTSGGALIVNLAGGCSFTNTFELIDKSISSCEGSSASIPNNIFISQVTDSGNDSMSYIELYNGTGAIVNINNYSIRVYNNGRSTPLNSNYIIDLNNVNLGIGSTYVLAIGASQMRCEPEHDLTNLADQVYTASGVSINFSKDSDDTIGHDHIRLYSNTTHIDSWGIFEDQTWATSLNLGGKGANFMRKTDVTVPNIIYSNNDWIIQDWGDNCYDLDYSDIGTYDFSVGTPPSVSILTPPTLDCEITTSLSVVGTEGFAGGNGLAYQWYYSAPGDLGWTAVPDNAIYDDVNTATLQILNTSTLNGYQYYCQVRENDATCFVASNAIKLEVDSSIWNGTTWLPNAPTINSIAIIDGDYNTLTNGSFSSCQLIVNPAFELIIGDNTFVEVQNNVTINGSINVKSKGSFVQISDTGLVNGDVLTTRNKIVVEKETALMNNWYEYTYWSSPVFGETIGQGLNEGPVNRRFWYDAKNFRDSFAEIGNNNTPLPGQDDIDDNGDDWTLAPAVMVMIPGVGYASTLTSSGFIGAGTRYQFTFEGPFNNGVITVPIYRNDAEMFDNNWNFIGNPYPSAISANSFLAANTNFDLNGPGGPMTGAIFLWSQNTPPSGTANGNENLNFANSDFAIINGTGQTAGGDGVIPARFIPSGQGFFVAMANAAPSTVVSGTIRTANVNFDNSMRVKTNNEQFFRTSDLGALNNKIWINLTSNNGVFNQILVGYVNGATDGNDGMYYDATKNLSSGANTIIYTLIDSDANLKLAIQGKNPNNLNLEESIKLGFYTSITEPTNFRLSIAGLEGDFLTTNTIYLVDHLMNLTFNLSAGDYIFSSDKGEFNERFEIVFRDQALSVVDNELPLSGLSIIELPNGEVKFTVGNNLNIQQVEIMDLLGRTLYQLRGNHSSEVYDLSNLSQAAYMAKVTLSNGQVLVKKAVKQR